MRRTLYLDCASGASGDMFVGALLDAGASADGLTEALASLGVEGFEVRVGRKIAAGVDCCDFDVVLDAAHANHDHDMDYLYGNLDAPEEGHHHHHGHEHGHGHGHHHHEHHGEKPEHDHHHDHGHGHHHEHGHGHHHHHEHRQLADVLAIVERATLTPAARAFAEKAFTILAEAEAKAHGTTPEEVHFHEVGAIDSIVDVIAAAYCLDNLGVDDVVVSPVMEGRGRVRTQHGVLPVPVPAVANIMEASSLTLAPSSRMGEFVTPTGAALLAAAKSADALPSPCSVVAVGMGSGKRAYEPVSFMRAMVVEEVGESEHPCAPSADSVMKLETEMDDCTGEALAFTLERLYEAGAREAHFISVIMKKGRPGSKLEVICNAEDVPALERVIFEHTTTIGIRRMPVDRTVLPRQMGTVKTCYGTAQVKLVTLPGGVTRAYPEHDSVAALAERHGVSYQLVSRSVIEAATSLR